MGHNVTQQAKNIGLNNAQLLRHTQGLCSFPYSFLFITASLEDYLSFGEVGNEALCEQRGITLYLIMRNPMALFDCSTGDSPY